MSGYIERIAPKFWLIAVVLALLISFHSGAGCASLGDFQVLIIGRKWI
jgi:hypothetical protein